MTDAGIRVFLWEPVKLPPGPAVVAFDLATVTGLAVSNGVDATAGSIRLSRPGEVGPKIRGERDVRFERLAEVSRDVFFAVRPAAVVWEDVQFCSSAYQFQLWCTLRAAVWAAIGEFERGTGAPVRRLAVPVGTLKQHATGSGAADKMRMMTAAIHAGGIRPGTEVDDNAVDAFWLAHYFNQKT